MPVDHSGTTWASRFSVFGALEKIPALSGIDEHVGFLSDLVPVPG